MVNDAKVDLRWGGSLLKQEFTDTTGVITMLYNAQTPADYISLLDDDWRRETLLQLRALITAQAPELDETIHYKMLGYGSGDNYVFHLNAQKGYVSLYVGNASKIDPDGVFLNGLNVGKGCVRFSKTKSVSETRIDAFIGRAVDLWKAGVNVDC